MEIQPTRQAFCERFVFPSDITVENEWLGLPASVLFPFVLCFPTVRTDLTLHMNWQLPSLPDRVVLHLSLPDNSSSVFLVVA